MSDYINDLRFDTKKAEDYFARKLAFTVGPVELREMMKMKKVKLIDVRHKEDFALGHIPEAISIPKPELEATLRTLSKNDVHALCCYNQQCQLAAGAALFMAKNDYPVMELTGGFQVWSEDFNFEVVQ